jgi:hypothetical protein
VLLVAKKRSAPTALHADLREGRVDGAIAPVREWRDVVRTVDQPLETT